jgi:UDP-GlcNAc3NAcA epimerase
MKKIVSVAGNRPQFIKSFPLIRAFNKRGRIIQIHSGQHYDALMSDIFFRELNIPQPDYFLSTGSGSHGYQTGTMLINIEKILIKEEPSMIVVYGDTNTTVAGALAASKLNIPVAHVEAGMRCGRKIPEETNRIITDHISGLLFCSTEEAARNLRSEGIKKGVHVTGDIMYDSLLMIKPEAKKRTGLLNKFNIKKNDYCLMTVHRAQNTEGLESILRISEALREINNKIIFPVHPRTAKLLSDKKGALPGNVILTDPLGYFDMIFLLMNSKCVLTDSGGLQKEAYLLKKKCITLRDETEWKETVKSGWNSLAGTDPRKIIKAFNAAVEKNEHPDFYGKGRSASQMVEIMEKFLTSC